MVDFCYNEFIRCNVYPTGLLSTEHAFSCEILLSTSTLDSIHAYLLYIFLTFVLQVRKHFLLVDACHLFFETDATLLNCCSRF